MWGTGANQVQLCGNGDDAWQTFFKLAKERILYIMCLNTNEHRLPSTFKMSGMLTELTALKVLVHDTQSTFHTRKKINRLGLELYSDNIDNTEYILTCLRRRFKKSQLKKTKKNKTFASQWRQRKNKSDRKHFLQGCDMARSFENNYCNSRPDPRLLNNLFTGKGAKKKKKPPSHGLHLSWCRRRCLFFKWQKSGWRVRPWFTKDCQRKKCIWNLLNENWMSLKSVRSLVWY